MASNDNKSVKRGAKKLLILGLDKAGKTSIVLSLKGKTSLLSFYKLNPTRGEQIHNFQTLNSEFNIWDFGGQERYRKDYFKDFKKYLLGTSKLIFVIDIQDKDRYDLALDYFQKIMNLLTDNTDIDFSIFLHKFDPDLRETHPEITNSVVDGLIQQIKDIIPSNIFYNFFKTTIYTVFDKAIID